MGTGTQTDTPTDLIWIPSKTGKNKTDKLKKLYNWYCIPKKDVQNPRRFLRAKHPDTRNTLMSIWGFDWSRKRIWSCWKQKNLITSKILASTTKKNLRSNFMKEKELDVPKTVEHNTCDTNLKQVNRLRKTNQYLKQPKTWTGKYSTPKKLRKD